MSEKQSTVRSHPLLLALLGLLALFYTASGLLLYFTPEDTFAGLPAYYGDFNLHFVKDAGLAFLSSGVLLLAAVRTPAHRLRYSLCGALFVVLHALFHLQMLVGGMIPPDYYGYEFVQIFLPALLLVVAVAWLASDGRQSK